MMNAFNRIGLATSIHPVTSTALYVNEWGYHGFTVYKVASFKCGGIAIREEVVFSSFTYPVPFSVGKLFGSVISRTSATEIAATKGAAITATTAPAKPVTLISEGEDAN